MDGEGRYTAELDGTKGPMTVDDWREDCAAGLLFQRHRGGGTFVVFHQVR